jgi:hypothetical protein
MVAREALTASRNRGGAIGPRDSGGVVLGKQAQCWRSPEGWEELRMKYACIFLLTLEVSDYYGSGSWKVSVELEADNRRR